MTTAVLKTQVVSTVSRASNLLPEVAPKVAIETLVGGAVEACSEYAGRVVPSSYHPLVAAICAAFSDHRPLVLSPDMFWLLIAQGFAHHVNQNPAALRKQFVKHDGKVKILVRRDDFIKGSPENPWAEVFSSFSKEILNAIGPVNHESLVVSFSTTGQIERAANEVALMDTMQNYFEYDFATLCGIPEVMLEGHREDWELLRDKTLELGKRFDVGWWTSRLMPRLEEIAQNAAGKDNSALWRDVFKVRNVSGGPYLTGWIVDFFPYLLAPASVDTKGPNRRRLVRADELFGNRPQNCRLTAENLPGSLCRVPFRWSYLDRAFEMEFIAGFIGFTQDAQTFAVRPKIGWAVREAIGCSSAISSRSVAWGGVIPSWAKQTRALALLRSLASCGFGRTEKNASE